MWMFVACAFVVVPIPGHAKHFGDTGTVSPNGVISFTQIWAKPRGMETTKSSNLTVAPKMSYFLADNLALSAGLDYSRDSSMDEDLKTAAAGITIGLGVADLPGLGSSMELQSVQDKRQIGNP